MQSSNETAYPLVQNTDMKQNEMDMKQIDMKRSRCKKDYVPLVQNTDEFGPTQMEPFMMFKPTYEDVLPAALALPLPPGEVAQFDEPG